MIKGIAIDPGDMMHGMLMVPIDRTISAKTLKLIDVLKCPECGHSDNGSLQERKFLGCENHNE
jgi:hypothetical protein